MATDPLRDKLDQAADRADAASTAFYAVLTNNKETPVPVEGGTVDSMSKRIYDQVGAQIDAINEKADEAAASAASANASKDAAANSATQANNEKTAAEGARDTAVQAKDQAQTAAQASQASAVSAQSSASNSSNSASQAADSANTAITAANQSVQAKDAANVAKNAAQASEASAESSKNAAATSASNSASSEAAAKGYSEAALAYRDSSLTNANSAAASATQSAASAAAALTSAQDAKTAATSAASANTSAQSSKDAAATSAASASQSATNAASSATVAGQKETGAISAANSAEASKTQAQTSSTSAQGFATQAQASAAEASGYLDDVEQSASDASASATSAQDSKDAAALSATEAQSSATSAASSASDASNSAQDAAASVSSIGSAVSDAQAAAQASESSSTAAQASATQAANSAASITSTVEFAQYTFESESAMVTDGAHLPNGAIIYLRDTGKTFEKSGNTYTPQIATNPIRAVLSYDTYEEAQAAAETLPDGQGVSTEGIDYNVFSGVLISQKPSPSVAEVGTVSLLRELPPPKRECTVYVRGYHTENDGGGGHFLWVPASNKPDNGGNVIAPKSAPANGRWEWDGAVDVRRFGAQLNQGDSTDAIRAAIKTGNKILIDGIGDYYVSGELEITQVGQVIEWVQTGGYGYGTTSGAIPSWKPLCRIQAVGTFAKRIRTRRLYRSSAESPNDPPLSVVFNTQADGVQFIRPAIDLYCDYSNVSPSNEGDDCDVAIFIGTRVGVQIHDPIITGYFRRYGILNDFTGATNLPRFPDLNGTPYPSSNVNNGCDGAHIYNPYIRGARVNIGTMGALPASGFTTYGPEYFDQILGAAVSDARGTFGASDYLCIGGRLYGVDHHSGWRRVDPILVGGVLSLSSLDLEPDTSPCCLHVDGMTANASGGAWGMRFIGTRFACFEALRIRFGRASRVTFFGCHMEARNGSGLSAEGQPIDTNNTTTISYGDIAANTFAGYVRVLSTNRQGVSDGLGNHFYGKGLNVETDSGRYEIPVDGFIQSSDDIDLRSGTGILTIRQGDATIGTIRSESGLSIRSASGDLDMRSGASGLIRIRSGSSTVSTISNNSAAFTSTIRHSTDNTHSFGSSDYRGATIYLGTNPIVTSDARGKSTPINIEDNVLDAWGDVQIICYQWLDSIFAKGEYSARWHFGVIAQQVRDAFAARGLDGTRYGLLCYDEWEAQEEVRETIEAVLDDGGNLVYPEFEQVVQPRREAGNRWGIRADQCLFLEAAYQRRRADRIEARLDAAGI